MARLVALALLVVAACGNVPNPNSRHDAAIDDAAIDSSLLADAPPDVSIPPDAAPPREAREFVSGGTRMIGTTYTLEVQLGHSAPQGKVVGSTYKLEGNAAVKP